MTHLLVRLFIKDKENTSNPKVRTAYSVMASVVGIFCNLILFGVKIFIGTIIHSISVTADAFNNLSDSASSCIGLIGVKIANKPADKDHPFGHGRYEYITALAVAFLVLQVGFSCLKSAVSKIFNPEKTEFQWVVIAILIVSILLKAWLSVFNKKLAKTINSSVLKATAADALGDAMITTVTVISLLVERYSGLCIDGFMGTAVSIFVLFAGINIARDTLKPLIGEPVDKEVFQEISKKIMSYPHILGSHDMIVHTYGPSHIMATVHCEVPNTLGMEEAHEIIDRIERDVLREMNIFLVIHMDPIEVDNVLINKTRSQVAKLVRDLESKATIHDFRMVNGEHQINLIFDLVLPYHYKEKEQEILRKQLENIIREIDERYQCIITIEKSYVREE